MSKKLAVGILASMAPEVLRQTLRVWTSNDIHVYIHVDAKADINAFAFTAEYPNVSLVSPRHRVMWGGFSLVHAELTLMSNAALDDFEYFLLISDDTIPLRTSDDMMDHLRSEHSWERIYPTDNQDIWQRYLSFHCADIEATNPRNRRWDYLPHDADWLNGLAGLLRCGKAPVDSLFWTSNWKVLTRGDVAITLDAYAGRGHLYESFRFSMNPDEHYIQTILGNRSEGLRAVRGFIWADFSQDPKPYVLRTLEDFKAPLEQGYLFARKVHDVDVATQMVERLGIN